MKGRTTGYGIVSTDTALNQPLIALRDLPNSRAVLIGVCPVWYFGPSRMTVHHRGVCIRLLKFWNPLVSAGIRFPYDPPEKKPGEGGVNGTLENHDWTPDWICARIHH